MNDLHKRLLTAIPKNRVDEFHLLYFRNKKNQSKLLL